MVDPELNALKREFLDEADQKAREIEASLDGKYNGASIERLSYLAHQLKGSGGSYGYARISTDAAEIEKAAESLAGGTGAEGVESRIRGLAESLRREIEKAIADLRNG